MADTKGNLIRLKKTYSELGNRRVTFLLITRITTYIKANLNKSDGQTYKD